MDSSATRTPLVLLHGVALSARSWDPVLPALRAHHEVLGLTLPGHRGGPGRIPGDTTLDGLVDWIVDQLDARGWTTPHVAGNSLGGWLALELARRGRAASVCALAPAGFWTVGARDMRRPIAIVRRNVRATRATAKLAPTLARSAALRKVILRDIVARGDRLSRTDMLMLGQDVAECVTFDEVCTVLDQIAPLDPPPCPITLAWPTKDRILPAATHAPIGRARIPGARTLFLDGLGHVPMSDDPQLVARTILSTTGAVSEALP